jgi:hypothetical protein
MGRIDDLSSDCRPEGYNFELGFKRVAFPDCRTYSNEGQIDTGSPQPPTLARLEWRARSDTTDGGLLAWRFKPNGKQVPIKKTCRLYISSASKDSGGLRIRRRRMLLPSLRPQDEVLKSKTKCLNFKSGGRIHHLVHSDLQ